MRYIGYVNICQCVANLSFAFWKFLEVLLKKKFPTCSLLIRQCELMLMEANYLFNSFLSTDCNIHCIFYPSDYHIYGLSCGLLILSKQYLCFSAIANSTARQQMSSSRAISHLILSETWRGFQQGLLT